MFQVFKHNEKQIGEKVQQNYRFKSLSRRPDKTVIRSVSDPRALILTHMG